MVTETPHVFIHVSNKYSKYLENHEVHSVTLQVWKTGAVVTVDTLFSDRLLLPPAAVTLVTLHSLNTVFKGDVTGD